MPRETLDRRIQALWESILLLDSMVETAVIDSVTALKSQNLALARKVYAADAQVNARRFEIENAVIVTIATQQPIMASDLRLLASMLEVAGELERMGDYAKGNARIAILIGSEPHIKPLIDILRMAELSVGMLHRAVSAFIARDADTARLIPGEDNLVDELYNRVFIDLVNIMLEDSRPETVRQANYLMWAAHNLERLADRVTNICERAVYVSTGVVKELDARDEVEQIASLAKSARSQ